MSSSKKLVFSNLLICCLLFIQAANASYKYPYQSQSEIGSAVANRNIEVLKENIHIYIDKDFRNARFVINYTFRINSDSVSIPFLFFSSEESLNSDKTVNAILDGKSVKVSNHSLSEVDVSDFLFPTINEENNITLSFGDFGNKHPYIGYYSIDDLIYIDTFLEEGIHTLQLEYTQSAWIDAVNHLKKRSFRYSLSAAKAWKPSEGMEIQLIPEDENQKYRINLQGNTGELNGKSDFVITEINEDFIAVTFISQLNFIQKTGLIVLKYEFLFFMLLSCILLWLEWKWIKRYRENHPNYKYSIAAIFGGIVLPVLAVSSFGLIIIGMEALAGPDIQSNGGFFSVLLFSLFHYWWVITPLLILIFLVTDRFYKHLLTKSKL